MNFNLIDFLIILMLIIGAINGFRKGFIGSLVGFLGSIAALLLAVNFYKPFASILNEKVGILTVIHGFLAEHLPLPLEVSTAPVSPLGLNSLAASINNTALPQFLKEQVISQAQSISELTGQLGISNIGELLTFIIATTLLNGLAFLLLWFVIDKIIYIAAKILSKSLDNTFLGTLNRVGGLIVGLALNALALMVITGIFSLFLEVTEQAQASMLVAIAKTVNSSVLVPWLKQGYTLLFSKIISFV